MRDAIWKVGVLYRLIRAAIASAIEEWRRDVWPKDPGAYYCCSGLSIISPCGCCGATVRDVYTPLLPAPEACDKNEWCVLRKGHANDCDEVPF